MSIHSRRLAPDTASLARLADPSVIVDGATAGALVLHGFTASPAGMVSLVAPLAALGVSVLVPALPGHGGHPLDLTGVTGDHWLAFVRDQLAALRARYRRVVAIGHSMGAALLRLALAEDARLADAVVHMSMPWRLFGRAARWSAPVFDVLPVTDRLIWRKDAGSDIADPAGRHPDSMYEWTPLRAVCELHKVLRAQAKLRAAADCPTLIVHSRHDHTAEYCGAVKLQRRLGAQAALLTVDRSYHVLPLDWERQAIGDAVAAFASNGKVADIKLEPGWRLS